MHNLTLFITNKLPYPHHTHYTLDDLNFNFRYARLCDLDIPREKWLNYLQTVETPIRCHRSGSALFDEYPLGGLQIHTCHWLLIEICEILQIFWGDLMKFCEIFMKLTFKLT